MAAPGFVHWLEEELCHTDVHYLLEYYQELMSAKQYGKASNYHTLVGPILCRIHQGDSVPQLSIYYLCFYTVLC